MADLSVFDVQNALKVHQKIGHDINGGGRTAIIAGQPYGMVLARKLYIGNYSNKNMRFLQNRLTTHIMQAEKPVISKVSSSAEDAIPSDDLKSPRKTWIDLRAVPTFPTINHHSRGEEHFFDTGHAHEYARGSNVGLVTHTKKLHEYAGSMEPGGSWKHGQALTGGIRREHNTNIHDALRSHTQLNYPTIGLEYDEDEDAETLPITARNLKNYDMSQALESLTSPTQLGSGLIHVMHRAEDRDDRFNINYRVDTHYLYDPQSESLNRVEMPPERNVLHRQALETFMRW